MFFRKFAASSRVEAPYTNDPPGLEGDPQNLIIEPYGWIVLAVHYFGFVVFQVWSKFVTKAAKDNVTSVSSYAVHDDMNGKGEAPVELGTAGDEPTRVHAPTR
jgi:hypothetical protein